MDRPVAPDQHATMRIGLVSDTHGRFDPLLADCFRGCERILHAGDIVGAEVLERLDEIATTIAVRGNNDIGAWAADLPEVAVVEWAGLRILVIHELGKPLRLLPAAAEAIEQADAQIVIYGHSHRPAIDLHGGRLFINPGSAGPRRFRLPRCCGILELKENRAKVKLLDLEAAGSEGLPGPVEVDF